MKHAPNYGYYQGICPDCDHSFDVHEDHVSVKTAREIWEAKLDGIAFPVMESFITEDEAKEAVIDFVLAIAKLRKTVNDERAGIQIDLVKMAFTVALNVMDEYGW